MKCKRIIALVSVFCMIFVMLVRAQNITENIDVLNGVQCDFSVTAARNDNLMSKMLKTRPNSYIATKELADNEILLNVVADGTMEYSKYNSFTVTGYMAFNGKREPFSTNGDLYVALTEDEQIGMYGTLVGYLGNEEIDEKHLTLNIQYIPKTSEVYAFASIGLVTESTAPYYIVFGNPVEKLYPIIMAAAESKNAEIFDNQVEYDKAEIDENPSIMPFAANDYNTNYIGASGSYGNGYQLTALAFFAPNRIKTNSSYKMYTKVTTSNNNAYNYIRKNQFLYGTTQVWLDKVYIYQGSTGDKDFEVSNLSPAQKTSGTSISFGIPVWNSGLSIFNISISLPQIWTSTARYSGSTVDNSAQWSFFTFPSQMEWQNGSCASTKGGVSGCSTITYYKNRTSNYGVDVVGKCEATFSWQDTYMSQVTTGSFTTTNNGVSHTIMVDAN